jgi:hypothetical protein
VLIRGSIRGAERPRPIARFYRLFPLGFGPSMCVGVPSAITPSPVCSDGSSFIGRLESQGSLDPPLDPWIRIDHPSLQRGSSSGIESLQVSFAMAKAGVNLSLALERTALREGNTTVIAFRRIEEPLRQGEAPSPVRHRRAAASHVRLCKCQSQLAQAQVRRWIGRAGQPRLLPVGFRVYRPFAFGPALSAGGMAGPGATPRRVARKRVSSSGACFR